VSAHHLTVAGADYAAHAADYVARTGVALRHYVDRHGPLAVPSEPVVPGRA
jgi:hypothetical protein